MACERFRRPYEIVPKQTIVPLDATEFNKAKIMGQYKSSLNSGIRAGCWTRFGLGVRHFGIFTTRLLK